MTEAGGPAAINGFLYQMLHHLGWLADVTLTGIVDGQEVEDACLVLEPRAGGDAYVESAGRYIVEQYKTLGNGTWALSSIESVLCDLRKAVRPSLGASATYRFVTNGRPGRLDAFDDFLTRVRTAVGPDSFSNDTKRKFRNNFIVTDREFFDHINAATRSGGIGSAAEDRAALFHLLSRFEMEFCVNGSVLETKLEKLLRRYAPDLGEEGGIRLHLIGLLLEELSQGETRLDAAAIQNIFQEAGLSPERLHRLAELSETMSALTKRRLGRLKYHVEQDVRDIPNWPEDKPVMLITGESGLGKTWQLGRLLESLGDERHTVTLVLATQSWKDPLTQAAQDVWQRGLGETSDKTLVAVSHFLRELEPHASTPRLIVALDDVQDMDVARALVRQDWTDWGMRLVLTVPPTVAQALECTDEEFVHVHSVKEFSVEELDSLLKQKGQRWANLPSDLKPLLRKPILAGLFLKLPYISFQSAPRSEYEIFEEFWRRIAAKGIPGDEGIVMTFAAHVREGRAYPLLRPKWDEIGLTEKAFLRLEAAGWLRSTEGGEVTFAHDRLLNWAVAKSLALQFERRELSEDDLGVFLAGEGREHENGVLRRLVYVPMDVLWLLAGNGQKPEVLSAFVARMEDGPGFGRQGETLYVELLPTLGQKAVPILLHRLRDLTTDSSGDHRVRFIRVAFGSLARQQGVDLKEAIDSLLNSSCRDLQNVAFAPLNVTPNAEYLDRLWQLHEQRLNTLRHDLNYRLRHQDYEESFAVLRSTIELNPEWLRDRILNAGVESESASELAYLLSALEHPGALAIWNETGHRLVAEVPASAPRSLLNCIARFSDVEKLDFVIRHLSVSEDCASGAALKVLAQLDPRAAVDRLVEVEDAERYMTRNQWLPILLYAQPRLTRQRVRELSAPDVEGYRFIVDLFWERPDQMDEAMLRTLLGALEHELGIYLGKLGMGDPRRLHHPLDFLGRIARPELVAVLQGEAGSRLEEILAAAACARSFALRNERRLDDILENARRILILIGGEGITELIKEELESEHFWRRHDGLKWAAIRTDEGIVERLTAIASRPVQRDSDRKINSEFHQEFAMAMAALVALGADSALVEILNCTNLVDIPRNLPQLRAHQGPMPKTLSEPAVRILQSVAPSKDAILKALLIAAFSGDPDIIASVRAVLERADPQSQIAAYACFALQTLGDSSKDFAQLADRLLHTTTNADWGFKALIGMGNHGAEFLANWVSTQQQKNAEHESQAIRALYDNPGTRGRSIQAAVTHCRPGETLFKRRPYDIAAKADDPALREQILDKAFAARSFVTEEPLQAIEGLTKFDVARAIEAIEVGLQNHPKIERELCRLLVRIAPDTAAAKLMEAALSIDRKSLCRAAGHALRRLDPDFVSRLVAERMKGSMPERKVAIEIGRWLPTPAVSEALVSCADYDSADEVRHAALSALEDHRREDNIRKLLAAFPEGTPQHQWGILIAILEAGDPYLLSDHEDPLWLGKVLSDGVPAAFEHHANSVLRQRMRREG